MTPPAYQTTQMTHTTQTTPTVTRRPAKPARKTALRAAFTAMAAAALALTMAGTATAAPYAVAVRGVSVDGQRYLLRAAGSGLELSATGGTVNIVGSGYKPGQGIDIAMCVIPDGVTVGDTSTYTQKPAPCLDGPGATFNTSRGDFDAALSLKPEIAPGVVCGETVRCAVVTKADDTAPSQRLFDQYLKVNFS
ncbi:hypothetical protein [Streptomyces otsuchiensis]|uniref:hypothetical protein n=1 Tax=Streptomyces otsuchiensis TaxID=2681388 RepID=UPI001D131532|nr:hypothetical protein [Streptomyces otsuchiensis]